MARGHVLSSVRPYEYFRANCEVVIVKVSFPLPLSAFDAISGPVQATRGPISLVAAASRRCQRMVLQKLGTKAQPCVDTESHSMTPFMGMVGPATTDHLYTRKPNRVMGSS